MGGVKDIVIKVIPAQVANPFVRRVHYSGKVVNNSQVHFGCFLDGALHGVLSYGPSMVKKHLIGVVEGTGWNEFIELNRMAFDDYLPRNSESYCIAKTLRMLKKNAPQIKWVVSFADGTNIAGLILTAHPYSPEANHAKTVCGLEVDKKYPVSAYLRGGAKKKEGFMLRYIYFLDPRCRKRLTVPEIPFTEIDKVGAGMYKGERVTRAERHIQRESD